MPKSNFRNADGSFRKFYIGAILLLIINLAINIIYICLTLSNKFSICGSYHNPFSYWANIIWWGNNIISIFSCICLFAINKENNTDANQDESQALVLFIPLLFFVAPTLITLNNLEKRRIADLEKNAIVISAVVTEKSLSNKDSPCKIYYTYSFAEQTYSGAFEHASKRCYYAYNIGDSMPIFISYKRPCVNEVKFPDEFYY